MVAMTVVQTANTTLPKKADGTISFCDRQNSGSINFLSAGKCNGTVDFVLPEANRTSEDGLMISTRGR